jgi:hypothetical protein
MPVRKGGTMIRGNDLLRFESKTRRDGDCVMWTGSVDKDGYGKFATGPGGGQKHHRPHRWIFERLRGPIPDGLVLMHTCDRPGCVNVDHLVVGTQKENIHDAIAKGRHFSVWRRQA